LILYPSFIDFSNPRSNFTRAKPSIRIKIINNGRTLDPKVEVRKNLPINGGNIDLENAQLQVIITISQPAYLELVCLALLANLKYYPRSTKVLFPGKHRMYTIIKITLDFLY